jgi:hypothetical protein
MGMPVKLSDNLVRDAREEAKAADRSVPSQIEHWARLGRTVESVLRYDDVVALKRADEKGDTAVARQTRRTVVAALRRIAADGQRPELAEMLMRGRTVYQDAGDGRIEQIEQDGTRRIGRIVNRRFTPDEPQRSSRHK